MFVFDCLQNNFLKSKIHVTRLHVTQLHVTPVRFLLSVIRHFVWLATRPTLVVALATIECCVHQLGVQQCDMYEVGSGCWITAQHTAYLYSPSFLVCNKFDVTSFIHDFITKHDVVPSVPYSLVKSYLPPL